MEELENAANAASEVAANTPLKKTYKPNTDNPATFTAALDLEGVIVAADDLTPLALNEFKAAQEPLLKEISQRQVNMQALAAQRPQGTTPDAVEADVQRIRADYDAEEAAYDAAQSRKCALWEETARRQFKGALNDADGQFYSASLDDVLPIPPAHSALIGALIARAQNGKSGSDFSIAR
jgi:hypothetical protein